METIVRSFEAEMSILEGERAVLARINTASVDRLRTVIDPLGCDVTHFNKTRSVLWQHGLDPVRGTVPMGTGWVKVRRAERDMLGKTTFPKDDPFCDQLFEGYKTGTLRGWSIKAGVHLASPPTHDEMRSNAALEECEMIYRKWDLIEYSGTPTPGNSDCLTMLVSRGLITAPAGFVPTVPVIEAPAEVHLEPYLKEEGGNWTVYHADGQRALSAKDPVVAQECLQLLMAQPSADRRSFYHSEATQILAETRRMFGDIGAEIKEYIDLYRHGRI